MNKLKMLLARCYAKYKRHKNNKDISDIKQKLEFIGKNYLKDYHINDTNIKELTIGGFFAFKEIYVCRIKFIENTYQLMITENSNVIHPLVNKNKLSFSQLLTEIELFRLTN